MYQIGAKIKPKNCIQLLENRERFCSFYSIFCSLFYIDFVFSMMKATLREILEKYSKSYCGIATTDFYWL